MTGRASPPAGLRCAPTAYAAVSDCMAAVGVSGIAPLTRCRGGDVVPYSDVWHCTATAFAGAAPLARCSRIALLLNIIPPYYNLRVTKHAAFQQFPQPSVRGAPRRIEVVDMTVPRREGYLRGTGWGARFARQVGCLAAIVVAPQVGDVAPVLAALLAHRAWWSRLSVGSRHEPRPGHCVSPCPPASCTPRRWTPAPTHRGPTSPCPDSGEATPLPRVRLCGGPG